MTLQLAAIIALTKLGMWSTLWLLVLSGPLQEFNQILLPLKIDWYCTQKYKRYLLLQVQFCIYVK